MESSMHFGGAMFFTEYSMSAMELARALEERGFESVWAPEHSHIPLSRKTPFPGGGDLPKEYHDAQLRHRRAAGPAARRDPDRQAGRLDRPGEPGALPVRRRRRLEPGRNGKSRHDLRQPLQAHARIHRGDE